MAADVSVPQPGTDAQAAMPGPPGLSQRRPTAQAATVISRPAGYQTATCQCCTRRLPRQEWRIRGGKAHGRVRCLTCAAPDIAEITWLQGWQAVPLPERDGLRAVWERTKAAATMPFAAGQPGDSWPAPEDPFRVGLKEFARVPWRDLARRTPTLVKIPPEVKESYHDLMRSLVDIIAEGTQCDAAMQQGAWRAVFALSALFLASTKETRGGAKHRGAMRRVLLARGELLRQGRFLEVWDSTCRATAANGAAARGHDDREVARRVASYAADGAQGRAMQAVLAETPLAVGPHVVPALRQHYRDVPLPPAGALPDQADMHEAEEHCWQVLAKLPRRRAADIFGTRYEHIGALRECEALFRQYARCLLRLYRDLDGDTGGAYWASWVVPLAKTDGGVRPLLIGTVARRLVERGLQAMFADEAKELLGDTQFAGGAGGAELLHRVASVHAQCKPEYGVLALDLKEAFVRVDRGRLLQHLAAVAPRLARWTQTLLCREHMVLHSDPASGDVWLRHSAGLSQGDPLSPLLFQLAVAPLLAKLKDRVTGCTEDAKVLAYVDDWYIIDKPDRLPAHYDALAQLGAEYGVVPNKDKTTLYAADMETTQTDYGFTRVPTLKVLKHHAAGTVADEGPFPTDWAPSEDHGDAIVDRRRHFFDRLMDLHAAGLPEHYTWLLARTYAASDITYVARLVGITSEHAIALDQLAGDIVARLLQVPALDTEQRARLFLPMRDGGMGWASAELVGPAALTCSFCATLPRMLAELECADLHELVLKVPAMQDLAMKATELVAEAMEAELPISLPLPPDQVPRQRHLMRAAHEGVRANLLATLPPTQRAWFRSCGGPGAGAWMGWPPDGASCMPDGLFVVAARLRLGTVAVRLPSTCPFHTAAGGPCGGHVDEHGHHCLSCTAAGHAIRRHNALRDALAAVVATGRATEPRKEVAMPLEDGAARADVEWTVLPEGRYRITDLAVTNATAISAIQHGAEHTDGTAARMVGDAKRQKYSRSDITPMIMESGGRFSDAFRTALREVAPLAAADRSTWLARAYYVLGMTVQSAQARTLRAAQV